MAVAYQEKISQSSNSATSLTATGFASLAVGDLMVAQFVVSKNTITVTKPASWTTVIQTENVGNAITSFIAYKIADAGDVSGNSFQFSHNGAATAVQLNILRITGHRTASSITVSSGTSTNSSLTINVPTATPLFADSLLLMFTYIDTTTSVSGYTIATSNPTWTEIYDSALNFFTCSAAYGPRTAITATGAGSATAANSSNNVGQLVVVNSPQSITQSDTVVSGDAAKMDQTILHADTIVSSEVITKTTARLWTKVVRNIKSWTKQNR